jgi:4a-hydroxytetrahydrobiopterin dehydratase
MRTLSPQEIAARLPSVAGWELAGTEIRKRFRCADFKGALAFVNAVGALAEAADHHPDITINYDRVTLALSTHAAGGLTERDFALAAEIETIAP